MNIGEILNSTLFSKEDQLNDTLVSEVSQNESEHIKVIGKWLLGIVGAGVSSGVLWLGKQVLSHFYKKYTDPSYTPHNCFGSKSTDGVDEVDLGGVGSEL